MADPPAGEGWINRQPLAFGLLVAVIHLLLMVAVSRALPVLRPAGFPDLGATLVNLASLTFGLGIVAWLGWWQRAALVRFWPRRDAWTLLPLLLMPFSYLVWGVGGSLGAWSLGAWLSGAALFLALGFNEELMNRGIVQGALFQRGVRYAVLVSAVLFGLGHAVNALFFGRDWFSTLAQMLSALAYGVSVGAVRWRIGTIWPLALFHGLDDLLLRQAGTVPAWWHFTLMLFNFGYGGWLLWRFQGEPKAGNRFVGR